MGAHSFAARTADTLFLSCQHTTPTLRYVIGYCILLSSAFVGGLYLIPSDVRHLPREDERQIKWRIISVLLTCLFGLVAYPTVFCTEGVAVPPEYESPLGLTDTNVGAVRYMGWSWDVKRDVKILLHVMTLYLGPLSASFAKLHMARTKDIGKYKMTPRRQTIGYYQAFQELTVKPTIFLMTRADSAIRWGKVRDLIVAPLAEEVVFRCFMVAPLLKAGMSPTSVAWTAPLFFGIAHAHHAFLKIREGMTLNFVLLTTAFQFAYTTLFGSYATHAYIRTASLPAIYACHAFCNIMGLPNFGFISQSGSSLSCIYQFRYVISSAYLLGIILFVLGFSTCEKESSRNYGGTFPPSGIMMIAPPSRSRYFPEESILPGLMK